MAFDQSELLIIGTLPHTNLGFSFGFLFIRRTKTATMKTNGRKTVENKTTSALKAADLYFFKLKLGL